jgi:hypothetical protein
MPGIRIAIDVSPPPPYLGCCVISGADISAKRGGTFTDCVGNPGTGKLEDDVIIKLLSVDPQNYDDAPLEGIRRLLERFTGKEIPRGKPLDTSEIGSCTPSLLFQCAH